jgi:uroporphyrinogen-III decarboxylase
MTSRERLQRALLREPTDRVPVSTYELVGFNSKAFENREPSYRRLMDAVRAKSDCVAMVEPSSNETFLCSAHPVEMEVEERTEDRRRIVRRTLHTPLGELTSTVETIKGVVTSWTTEHWCKTPEDVDRALSVPYVPLRYDFSEVRRVRAEVGERGIVMTSLADGLLLAAELMEFGDFTVWATTEPEHFERTLRILHERNLENVRRMLQDEVVDLYRICGPEYATPPYLPPSRFRELVTRPDSELVDAIHAAGSKARLHCHGRIGRVLEAIADTGADALDPCEPPPDGDVALEEVKRRVGHRMCLFGNLELRILEMSEPAEVRAAVRRCMEQAKAGYGYVLMPTAAPIGIPLPRRTEENYLAFLDAAEEYGAY